jgi:hypothetical protein
MTDRSGEVPESGASPQLFSGGRLRLGSLRDLEYRRSKITP